MMINFAQLFEDSVQFIRRENALLVPLALATFVLGDAGRTLSNDALIAAGVQGSSPASFAFILSLLLSLLGQLATIALVLRPGTSLREAFDLGLRRMPRVIMIGLLTVSALLLMLLPAVMLLVRSGYDLTAAKPDIPPAALLYFLLVSFFGVWLAVRLTTMTAFIVDANPMIADAFRTSFAQTRGLTLRLFALFFVYLMVSIIVTGLAAKVLTQIFKSLGELTGMLALGHVVSAFSVAAVTGALSLIATVFVGHLYRAITSPSNNGM